MTEYIEKQRLLDFLDAAIEEEKGTRHQVIVEAIKLTVERMPAADVDIKRLETDLRDCRNELCFMCGDYRSKHLGSCDGCRWESL